MLPATLVRFVVHIKHPVKESGLGGESWLAHVTISPPGLRRILMPPLEEYLLVEMQVRGMQWVRSKWGKGDLAETMLRADGAMTIPCIILSSLDHSGKSWFIADHAGERDYALVEVPESIRLRVVYSLDNKIADEIAIVVKRENGKLRLS